MTRISIAMATYNGERFIREQLDSFAAQSRLPDQLIICDDGSADRTVAIAEEFAAGASFAVTVSRNPDRLGYSDNFSQAISLCDGDLIFLSDQDDVWFAEKIATVMEAFEAFPDREVVTNDQVIADDQGQPSGRTMIGNLRSVRQKDDRLVSGCATAVRRGFARELFPIPNLSDLSKQGHLTHDRWLNELATLLGVRWLVRQPLQIYRQHSSSVTKSLLHSTEAITFHDRASMKLGSAPIETWRRRMEVLDTYEDFLISHQVPGDKAAALRKIDHERSSNEQRIRLSALPRWRRPPHVWRLWQTDGYRYFERWLSAANDLVRPR